MLLKFKMFVAATNCGKSTGTAVDLGEPVLQMAPASNVEIQRIPREVIRSGTSKSRQKKRAPSVPTNNEATSKRKRASKLSSSTDSSKTHPKQTHFSLRGNASPPPGPSVTKKAVEKAYSEELQ
ncbi:unnamed protein product [Phytophthora fragariaefolia]|uniref:Unnamed protein product n=1 Tax=Phytophthora fragariaefolia TaxID=1490495 RepID=A0A9W6XTQ3_9STRA|nr:unnamed protein product [Phytophthora fragariaefolia]